MRGGTAAAPFGFGCRTALAHRNNKGCGAPPDRPRASPAFVPATLGTVLPLANIDPAIKTNRCNRSPSDRHDLCNIRDVPLAGALSRSNLGRSSGAAVSFRDCAVLASRRYVSRRLDVPSLGQFPQCEEHRDAYDGEEDPVETHWVVLHGGDSFGLSCRPTDRRSSKFRLVLACSSLGVSSLDLGRPSGRSFNSTLPACSCSALRRRRRGEVI